MMKTHFNKTAVLFAWLLIAGCMCVPPGLDVVSRPPTPTPGSFSTSTPEAHSTQPPLPAATSAPTSPPVAKGAPLNTKGPWLLISTDKGLWAINPDGTGLNELAQHSLSAQKLQNAIQPHGSSVAVITSGETQMTQLALNLVTLPDGKLEKITDLTTPKTAPGPDMGPGDPAFEALRAITERNSIAWSPDGHLLAFIGFMDGPAASVYLFDTATRKIKRVSQEPVNNYALSWSPDGQYESFGTGAGMDVKGVWKAAADGSKPGLLYTPAGSSGEDLLGWLPDSHQALLSSWSPVCGSKNLRLMDVASAQKTILVKDCFHEAALSDTGDILYGDTQQINLIKNGSKKAKAVIQGQASQIFWSQDSNTFIVRYGEGQLMTYVDNQGEVYQQKAPQPGLQNVAAYGAIWAWTNYDDKLPGVWITGPGLPTDQIYLKKAGSPAWDPQNNLLFFGENQVYHASFPTYKDVNGVADFADSVQEVKWMQWPN